jgi:hypothetical protein
MILALVIWPLLIGTWLAGLEIRSYIFLSYVPNMSENELLVLCRAVWHQADPISKGTRWALVIFYDVQSKFER